MLLTMKWTWSRICSGGWIEMSRSSLVMNIFSMTRCRRMLKAEEDEDMAKAVDITPPSMPPLASALLLMLLLLAAAEAVGAIWGLGLTVVPRGGLPPAPAEAVAVTVAAAAAVATLGIGFSNGDATAAATGVRVRASS